MIASDIQCVESLRRTPVSFVTEEKESGWWRCRMAIHVECSSALLSPLEQSRSKGPGGQ